MGVKPSILTSFKWQYVFVATMGHMVASGDVGSKWKPTHEFKLERVSREDGVGSGMRQNRQCCALLGG